MQKYWEIGFVGSSALVIASSEDNAWEHFKAAFRNDFPKMPEPKREECSINEWKKSVSPIVFWSNFEGGC